MEKRTTSPLHPFDGPFGNARFGPGFLQSTATASVAGVSSLVSPNSAAQASSTSPWANRQAGVVTSSVVEDGVGPGGIGDVLDSRRYNGRLLDPESEEAKRTNQRAAHQTPGLVGQRRRHGGRRGGGAGKEDGEEDEDEMHREGLPRVVVDGVEDLQHVTTGLLTRHLGEELNTAPATLAAQSVHYLATEPNYPVLATSPQTQRAGGQARLSSSTPPVDDRVTPKALHMLLRQGQQRAAHKLARVQPNGRYYTFTAGPGAKQAAAAALQMAEMAAHGRAKPVEAPLGAGNGAATASSLPAVVNKGRKRTKHTVKGATPQDFVRATHTPSAAALNPLLQTSTSTSAEVGATDEQASFLRAQLARSGISGADRHGRTGASVLAANIAYLEPPSITEAHKALFRVAQPDGSGEQAPVMTDGVEVNGEAAVVGTAQRRYVPYSSPRLQTTMPVPTATAMTYPPPPVTYNTADEAKRARDRHRLRAVKLRTKSEMEAAQRAQQQAAVDALSRGVKDALVSTFGDGAGDLGERDVDPMDDEEDPFDEDAKKHGVEMDIVGIKDGVALDFAFSAALRGDDRQLVEQLARQYGEQCLRRQLQARRRAQQRCQEAIRETGAAPPHLGTLTEQSIRARAAATGDTAAAPLAVEEPVFSVLESVLAVSREFEKMKPGLYANLVGERAGEGGAAAVSEHPASAAVPLESSALARGRRAVIDRLTGFGSSRVPGRFWVTLKERGAAAAGRDAVMSTTTKGAEHGGAGLGGYVRSKVPILGAAYDVHDGADSARHARAASVAPDSVVARLCTTRSGRIRRARLRRGSLARAQRRQPSDAPPVKGR